MKKTLLLVILSLLVCTNLWAQDDASAQTKEKDTPVGAAFESGILIDAQTTNIPDARTLEFVIQHKFGTMENGVSDLYGIYAPGANVRLGLNYVPVKNLQLGIGVTKTNMYTDFNAKWTILEQTEKNAVPFDVTLYGNMAINGQSKSVFGIGKVNHSGKGIAQYSIVFSDRLSYFSQLIISRKFNDKFSLQAGASFSHFNMIETDFDHDVIGAHLSGRYKFSSQSSFIFNYDVPLKVKDISEQTSWDTHANPNLSFGLEISTFTHAFQIYIGNANGILPQHNMVYNSSPIDFSNDSKLSFKNFSFGFTITRLWMF